MKKDENKIAQLKATLKLQIETKSKMREAGYSLDILETFDTNIDDLTAQIHRAENPKDEKSAIDVKFMGSGKEIKGKTAREKYKNTVIEFGVDKVKANFSNYFVRETSDKVNNLLVAPDTYLKATLSNAAIKKNIDAISESLRVKVRVTIIKKSLN